MLRDPVSDYDDASQDPLTGNSDTFTLPRFVPSGAPSMYPLGLDWSTSGLLDDAPTTPRDANNHSFSRYQFVDDGEGQLLMPPHAQDSAQFHLPEGLAWKPARHHICDAITDAALTAQKYLDLDSAVTWREEEESSQTCAILAYSMRCCMLGDTKRSIESTKDERAQQELRKRPAPPSQPPGGSKTHPSPAVVDSTTPSSDLLMQYRGWWRHEQALKHTALPQSAGGGNGADMNGSLPLSPLSPLTAICHVMSQESESGFLTCSLENNTSSRLQPLQSAPSANMSSPTILVRQTRQLSSDGEPASAPAPTALLRPCRPATTTAVLSQMASTDLAEALAPTSSPTPSVMSPITAPLQKPECATRRPSRLLLPTLQPLSTTTSAAHSKAATPLLRPSQRPSTVTSLLQSPVMGTMPVPTAMSSGERLASFSAYKKPHAHTTWVSNNSFPSSGALPREASGYSPVPPHRRLSLEPKEPICANTAEPLSALGYQPKKPRAASFAHTPADPATATHTGEHASPATGKSRFSQFLRFFSPKSRDAADTFEPGARVVGTTSASNADAGVRHFGSPPQPPSGAWARRRPSGLSSPEAGTSAPRSTPAPSAGDYAPVSQTASNNTFTALSASASAPDAFPLRAPPFF